jgi:hypothetical protein
MTTAYTNLLGFALPVTGELSGTWGQVVNDSITELVEDSIAGTASVSVTAGNVTLTTTGSGAANEARCAIIRATGTPGTTRNVIAPSSSKAYIVDNQSDSAIVFKGAATVGVTIAAGKQALVAWNGSDFVQVGASAGGSNTQVQYNDNGTLAGSANLTFNGSTLTAAGFSGPINGTIGASTPNTGVFTQVDVIAQGDLRLQDTTGGQFVAMQAPGTLTSSYTLTLPPDDGNSGQVLTTDGSGVLSWTTNGAGDVTGPASSTDNAIARYDLTTGKIIQNSGVTIDDSDNLTIPGQADLRLADSDSSNYVALQAPSVLASNYTLTLPTDDGTSGQFLTTDGSGVLSWSTVSSPSQAGGALIVNNTTATVSYTVASGSNAFSVGPITVADGVTVTVASGQRWVVI